ncbi:hypothetical protein CFC21_070015 [Triticum aestivum]|uniref:PDZ domain-containing protein n=2 Tax=Triticum aestivum TaxID=4565 RepID=A0A3B6LEP5_WHEAT|nr:uncharacterized protein LOC123110411 [Triticum aestivum]KAF7063499.1 hypothetical protein CFC21_070015 [Triticum aestivum]
MSGSGSSPALGGATSDEDANTSPPLQPPNPSTSRRRLPPWHPDFTGPYRLPETEYHPSELQPPARRRPTSEGASDSARTKRSKSGASESESDRETSSQEEPGSGSDSSAHSSPAREPEMPLVPIWRNSKGKLVYGFTDDKAAVAKYRQDLRKYEEKLAQQEQLLTLKLPSKASGTNECYGSPKNKDMILNAAKSILSLSAYLDGKEINRCTGIVVNRDEDKKSLTILTSAWLICTEKPSNDWLDKEYAPQAKVIVHLPDGTTVDSQLMYFSKHYDVAFYEITGDLHLHSLPLEGNSEFGREAFVLVARDTNLDLIYREAKLASVGPCEFQHNHYKFITCSIPNKCGTGGGLLDSNGKIVGLLSYTFPLVAFIPSSLIMKCSALLRKLGKIVRPQLGLKLKTLDLLGMSCIEQLSHNFNISSGLVVREVSAGCVAERLGIRVGDVILSCQGESVSSIAQFEDILLRVGEEHLEKSNDLTCKVDVQVGVFNTRKCTRKLVTLKVKLSDGVEVFR